MKRLALFICTLLCANVLSAQTEFIVGNLKYKVNSSNPTEVAVSAADATITTANIPATVSYNGTTYSVTSIRNYAFQVCSSLTSITIPNSVTSIGGGAFYDCSSLTSITIPNSVTSIGDYAFQVCSSLTSITIPNSVTSIGNSTFSGCSSLTSITIPNSVTSIGSGAFENCSSLTSITIPNSVTSIGNFTFSYCSSLTSITIPNSVTSIGWSAFDGCSSLTSVTIGSSVTSIEIWAFRNCSSLTSIDIPNSVTYIGGGVFYGCSSLTSVTLPNNITSLSAYYYTGYGDGVYYGLFEGCSSLTSITIPNSVTYIGGYVFRDCSSLTTLNFNAINCSDFNSASYPFYNLPITTINIGDSVQRIPAYFAYDLNSLTSITIPNSVTSIGSGAFENCSSLTSVTIPNSVTEIGEEAFKNCSSLTSVTIPNSVASIGYITLPNSVTSIGTDAFLGCNNLTSMTVECTNIPNLSNIGLNSTLQNLTLEENVASIASGAFNSYSFLQNVTCLATTPPTLADNTVFPYPNIATLTIPCGSLEAYSAPTSFWNMFFSGRISENGYNVEVSVNDETFGSVAVESDCSTGTLTATANEGYVFLSWNDGNTENPRVVSLTSDTSFTAIFALIDESSLLEAEAESISFFPNPTKSEITFSQAIEKVEVIDLTGKAILTFSNAKTINIESLPAGAYYLRLTNNDKAIIQKVIKE